MSGINLTKLKESISWILFTYYHIYSNYIEALAPMTIFSILAGFGCPCCATGIVNNIYFYYWI